MIPSTIVIHHTVSKRDTTTFEQVNAWHKARFDFKSSLGFYVAYHYLITGDGKVTQARQDNELGAHVLNQNSGKIGICLTGNFQVEEPSQAQIKSLEALVDRLKMTYGISNVVAHRDLLKTECCGENLYTWVLQQKVNWLKKLIAKLLSLKK